MFTSAILLIVRFGHARESCISTLFDRVSLLFFPILCHLDSSGGAIGRVVPARVASELQVAGLGSATPCWLRRSSIGRRILGSSAAWPWSWTTGRPVLWTDLEECAYKEWGLSGEWPRITRIAAVKLALLGLYYDLALGRQQVKYGVISSGGAKVQHRGSSLRSVGEPVEFNLCVRSVAV